MASYPVRDVAKAMNVHPRTILRAYMDQKNPSIGEDEKDNPSIDLTKLAPLFGTTPKVIEEALKGRDYLYSQIDTAAKLDVNIRTFKNRKYPVAVRRGRIVRYSWHDTVGYHHKHHGKDDDLESLR